MTGHQRPPHATELCTSNQTILTHVIFYFNASKVSANAFELDITAGFEQNMEHASSGFLRMKCITMPFVA
jgi:hypothetical protein